MVRQGKKARDRQTSPASDHTPTADPAEVTHTPTSLPPIQTRGRFNPILSDATSVHSPFFLHSADHPGLSIVTHLLDGTNYNTWSIAMRMSLDAKNKLSFVDGTLPRPDIDDTSFKIWSRCNSMVKAWLLNVVTREIYDSILYYEDAVEMWNDLFLRFRVSNLPRKYQLEQAIITLKQGNLDLSTYYTKKKTLWEQLANTKTSTVKRCNCDHVQELLEDAETSRIIQFLMGLNDSFANIRGQILNMKPRPGLTAIYNILDQDESQRTVGGSSSVQISNPAAFQIQSTPIGASTGSDQNQVLLTNGGYQKPKCSHCHKLGHTADKCYKLHGFPPGYGPKWKKPQTLGSTNLAVTPYQTPTEQKNDTVSMHQDEMSNAQIQTMISYLSSKLHVSAVPPTSETTCASTSNSVPVISQVTGTYKGDDDWSR